LEKFEGVLSHFYLETIVLKGRDGVKNVMKTKTQKKKKKGERKKKKKKPTGHWKKCPRSNFAMRIVTN